MLRIDRWCIYILMFGLITMIPSIAYVKMCDELCMFGLLGLMIADALFNGNWRRYKLLWIVMGVLTFYAVYSLYFVHYNRFIAIFYDWVIELKPFAPFLALFCIAPRFTARDKQLITIICAINASVAGFALFCGYDVIKLLLFHPTYAGITMFVSSIYIIFCHLRPDGTLSKQVFWCAIIMMTIGLLCGRSKFYGLYVLFMFFMFLYRPQFLRHLNAKHFIAIAILGVAVLGVSWEKFHFYFVEGMAGMESVSAFDPQLVNSFARPVLYLTSFQVLIDHFPFGSGLASLGTYASEHWYSLLYYEYGIDQVHGLQPNSSFTFITDAFYASLGQFGVVGIGLFVWWWVYCYSYIRALIRLKPVVSRYLIIIGSSIILFLLIESIGGNSITQSCGMVSMMLLGKICSIGREDKEEATVEARQEAPAMSVQKI